MNERYLNQEIHTGIPAEQGTLRPFWRLSNSRLMYTIIGSIHAFTDKLYAASQKS